MLREAWGFEGFVVSDWFATTSTAAAEAGLDLEMPGPPRHFGPLLAKAVEDGSVSRDALTRMARAVLVAAGGRRDRRAGSPAGRARRPRPPCARARAAASAFVLLENRDDLLRARPSDPARGGRRRARRARVDHGRRSVEVVPTRR